MDNYNPRQNTRMRWKDAKELEKFKFISGAFNFQNETLEHVSQDKEYAKLINIMKTDINNDFIPILLYDMSNQSLFTGCYSSTAMFLCTVISAHELEAIDISYEPNNDKMIINDTSEELLSADNVKTLFGNQSIIGQGNIDLYRHQLQCEISEDSNAFLFEIISSNNLKIDSLQDLTTVTKATNESDIKYLILDTSIWSVGYLYYQGGVWYIQEADGKLYTVASINDVVTTI